MAGPRILMGVIGRPHGVRGLLHVHSFADADLAEYAPLFDEQGRAWSLAWRGNGVAELRDVSGRALPDRNAAERLVNLELFVDRDRLPPADEDDFYWSDLVGLQALDSAGTMLGRVTHVHEYGGGPSLEIEGGLLVPFNKACVPVVDVPAGKLVIAMPAEILVPSEAEADRGVPA